MPVLLCFILTAFSFCATLLLSFSVIFAKHLFSLALGFVVVFPHLTQSVLLFVCICLYLFFIGVVLRAHGVRISAIKLDPYLNVDAGTMSPYEHGECYVLDDGSEVDLDLGNYERFLGVTLCGAHNLTSGKVYQQVLSGEREGLYLGKTVQMVPHVTDAIQRWILSVASRPVGATRLPPDVCLIEVGGTVGDIESAVYLEAMQQLSRRVGLNNFCLAHVSFVPFMGEQKTKPTQHGVKVSHLGVYRQLPCNLARCSYPLCMLCKIYTSFKYFSGAKTHIFLLIVCVFVLHFKELRGAGLAPDFVFCRSDKPLTEGTKQKVSLFAQVQPEHVRFPMQLS